MIRIISRQQVNMGRCQIVNKMQKMRVNAMLLIAEPIGLRLRANVDSVIIIRGDALLHVARCGVTCVAFSCCLHLSGKFLVGASLEYGHSLSASVGKATQLQIVLADARVVQFYRVLTVLFFNEWQFFCRGTCGCRFT